MQHPHRHKWRATAAFPCDFSVGSHHLRLENTCRTQEPFLQGFLSLSLHVSHTWHASFLPFMSPLYCGCPHRDSAFQMGKWEDSIPVTFHVSKNLSVLYVSCCIFYILTFVTHQPAFQLHFLLLLWLNLYPLKSCFLRIITIYDHLSAPYFLGTTEHCIRDCFSFTKHVFIAQLYLFPLSSQTTDAFWELLFCIHIGVHYAKVFNIVYIPHWLISCFARLWVVLTKKAVLTLPGSWLSHLF
jgi:hypothetical protein